MHQHEVESADQAVGTDMVSRKCESRSGHGIDDQAAASLTTKASSQARPPGMEL